MEQWTAVIDEMRISGMPQKQWCATCGINWGTLHAAQMRLNKAKREQACDLKFLQVQTPKIIPAVAITCNGITLSVSVKDAVAILAHLAGEAPC